MNTKLSIIIPVYNVEKYLSKCLDSILNQTFQNFEVFCIYDNSNDNSLKILKQYVQKDDRIKIIYSTKNDPGAARNLGLKAINSEFVTFMDSDDTLLPEAYELAMNKMKDDIDFVHFYANIVFEENEEISEVSRMQIKTAQNYHRIIYKGEIELTDTERLNTTLTVWNKIFRTELVKRHNIFFAEGINHEDAVFTNKYFIISKKAYYIDKYIHNYLQRTHSRMEHLSNKKLKSYCDRLILVSDIYDFLISKNLLKKHLVFFLNLFRINVYIAYKESPEEGKNLILEKSTEVANELNIDNEFINTLKNKEYSKALALLNII